jgi:hypothetical protein
MWLGLKIIAQGAVNGILDAVGWVLTALSDFSKGIANVLEAATHIPGAGGKFKAAAESARQGEQDLTQWAADLHKGVDWTSGDIAKMYPQGTKKIDTTGMPPDWAAIVGTAAAPAPGTASTPSPSVAHLHDSHAVNINGPLTIKAANLDDFTAQMRAEATRANFSGEAVATF